MPFNKTPRDMDDSMVEAAFKKLNEALFKESGFAHGAGFERRTEFPEGLTIVIKRSIIAHIQEAINKSGVREIWNI